MRRPIIPSALVALTLLAAAACGPSREETARAEAQAAAERAAVAARQEALRALRDVEAAIAEARNAIEARQAGSPTRADALLVSEIRRAIVVANVAVQKAREALGREDYAAAQQALRGAAARLRDVVSGKAGAGNQERKRAPGQALQDLPREGAREYADAATERRSRVEGQGSRGARAGGANHSVTQGVALAPRSQPPKYAPLNITCAQPVR